MADKADDAIALWQQMVGEMQKGFRTFGDQLSRGSPDQKAAGSDCAQRRLADLMESYFAGMHLPSRAQLNALSDRLQAIESELAEIKALLRKALAKPKPKQGAPKTARTAAKPVTAEPPQVPAGNAIPSKPDDGGETG